MFFSLQDNSFWDMFSCFSIDSFHSVNYLAVSSQLSVTHRARKLKECRMIASNRCWLRTVKRFLDWLCFSRRLSYLGSSFFERPKQGDLNKSPVGSINQKYVYACFMVKIRINLGSFGVFWFNLGWWQRRGRKMWSLNFCILLVKKFKFGGLENLGYAWINWSISQTVPLFCERTFDKIVGIWMAAFNLYF